MHTTRTHTHAGWGGALSVWDVKENRQNRCWVSRANEERCTDVVWHPRCVLACVNNGNVVMWAFLGVPVCM